MPLSTYDVLVNTSWKIRKTHIILSIPIETDLQ